MVIQKIILSLLLWLLFLTNSFSQQLISYVTTNKSSAYIGEPIELTVSVYSSTWFTSGIDVGNIQVEGAFTVFFRSVTNTKQFSGNNFAGVDFIYNVFPNKEGEITIPVLNINIESPKPGDHKGIAHTINTKPKTIIVKGVPLGKDPNKWLVSTSLNINENWSKSIENVKVGDVIQRSISRSAGNTVSEFIPPILWDSIQGVSSYPKRPSVRTNKTKTYVSAQRTESVNYLFEKEGEIIFPEIEFTFWNFRTKKFYSKKIPEKRISVLPNADLEMLISIKKSLSNKTNIENSEDEKKILILGISPKEFFKFLILSLIGLYFLIKIIKWSYLNSIKKYNTYLNSEKFAFRNIEEALNKKDLKKYLNFIHKWLFKLELKEPTLDYFTQNYGTEALKTLVKEYQNEIFNHGHSNTVNFSDLLKELKNSRKYYFKAVKDKRKKTLQRSYQKWLNPITKNN